MPANVGAGFLILPDGHSVINFVIGIILADSIEPAKRLLNTGRNKTPG